MGSEREVTSIGTELPKEIERVSAKRERWRGYSLEFGPAFSPGVLLMTAAIDAAHAAIANGDLTEIILAYGALKGFDNDD